MAFVLYLKDGSDDVRFWNAVFDIIKKLRRLSAEFLIVNLFLLFIDEFLAVLD